MAVEAKRGCGFRKVGGLYLVGGGFGIPCDRLPIRAGYLPLLRRGNQAVTWVGRGLTRPSCWAAIT